MPEYLAPGVYVEEVPSGNKPIEGVSTSTAGMVGVTQRGPVNTPTLVTSFAEFTRQFGGYLDHRVFTNNRDQLPYAVEGFFVNGGQRVYISRVVGDDATFAQVDLLGAPATNPLTTTLGADVAAGANTINVASIAGINDGDRLLLQDGPRSEYVTVDGTPAGNTVTLAEGVSFMHASGINVSRQVELLGVYARYQGQWGNRLRISVRLSSILETTVAAEAAQNQTPIRLNATFGLSAGSVLEVRRTEGDPPVTSVILRQRVTGVTIATGEVDLDGGADAALEEGDAVFSQEFDLIVERLDENDKVVESEVFVNLGVDPAHNRYAPRIVGAYDRASEQPEVAGESELIRLADLTREEDGDDVTGAAALRLSLPFSSVTSQLSGGDDDLANIDDDTYIGSPAVDPDDRTGIFSLENIDDISIVAAPGRTGQDVQNALINHCTLMRYRFAVLDSLPNARLRDVQTQRQLYDTTYGAIYYPWMVIGDPFGRNGDVRYVPPSGHVAGVYARSDVQRGVHKAPANEVVLGIRDLQVRLTKGEQDILNPKHINCLRDFREINRGLRVWGARTLSSDPEWKYVNVRRLFLFVEKSIERGSQFAVFEPNSEPLWATIHRSVSNFLTAVWRSGALEGTKVEEAFFVKVDRTTMTQNDIDNGRLIILVGIAPVRPAEFVIFRISQKTREATG
jgi:phage tail sheath protein FI